MTAPPRVPRPAMRVLCCLVAVRGGMVTEAALRHATGYPRRILHEAIRDLRRQGFAILNWAEITLPGATMPGGYQLWEPAA